MKIYYKIVSKDEAENSIVVRFYTDIITEEFLASEKIDGVITRTRTDCNLNLPIPTPTGVDLEEFIVRNANVYWFEMMEKVMNDEVDLSSLASEVGVEKTKVVSVPTPPTKLDIIRFERNRLLNEADTKYCNAEKWSEMTETQKTAWKAYKQALRDLPATVDVDNPVWPTMPNV